MEKKLVLDPILAHFGPQKCLCSFYFYLMLDIVASYHCMQI